MTINALRLSFVFTETILDLQRGKDSTGPLNSIIREPGYVSFIDQRQAGDALPLGLELPWPYPVGQHFWDRYLDEKTAGDADGKLCFQKLVPLRLPALAKKIVAKSPNLKQLETAEVRIEGYYYPFGAGLIVTVELAGALDITRTGELALVHRFGRIYEPTWADQVAGPMTLNQLATEALNRLRQLGFGSGISGRRSDLFSVSTILQGNDVDPNKPLVSDSPPHRLLNGLANWISNCSQVPAPPLVANATQLRVKGTVSQPGDVLFAGTKGRAVWLPRLFLPTTQKMHQLGCYHRNLTLASLQTESLLALAGEVKSEIQRVVAVPNSIQGLGGLAVDLLTRLYTLKDTYKSDSMRAQIEPRFADVNSLRKLLDLLPPP